MQQLRLDKATLTTWSRLLRLTEGQTMAALDDVDHALRLGHADLPAPHLHGFDELASDIEADELSLLFLISGLHRAGQHDEATAVAMRSLAALILSGRKTG